MLQPATLCPRCSVQLVAGAVKLGPAGPAHTLLASPEFLAALPLSFKLHTHWSCRRSGVCRPATAGGAGGVSSGNRCLQVTCWRRSVRHASTHARMRGSLR